MAVLPRPVLVLLRAPLNRPCEAVAADLVDAFDALSATRLKLQLAWRALNEPLHGVAGWSCALHAAGEALAAWADANAPYVDRHPYHNRQHLAEVLLTASLLARQHRLPTFAVQLLLVAALMHDLDHDGAPARGFVAERRSMAFARPFLDAAGVSPAQCAQLDALVLATEPAEGVRTALASASRRTPAAVNPAPPPAAPELQRLNHDPLLALLARLLCEADVLPSIGLTLAHGLRLQALLAQEWGRSLGPTDKLRFIDESLSLGVVGAFFEPNVQRLRKLLLASLDDHAVA